VEVDVIKSSIWQVWIADLRGSTKLTAAARGRAAKQLDDAIRATVARYRDAFKLRPAVLRGDEIQAVLVPDCPALTILTYLRGEFAMRSGADSGIYAGIGLGTIPMLHARSPFQSEGPAFHLARRALDSLKRKKHGRTLTAWVTGREAFDEAAMSILPLIDSYFARWTREQWEAVVRRLQGSTMKTIGAELGVAGQAVHKRLSAARWRDVEKAVEYLESEHRRLLESARPVARRVARRGAVAARA
jgi:hypothetical protein